MSAVQKDTKNPNGPQMVGESIKSCVQSVAATMETMRLSDSEKFTRLLTDIPFSQDTQFSRATWVAQAAIERLKWYENVRKTIEISDKTFEQLLGEALGFPAYKDDQKNFLGATEADGVCVGHYVLHDLVHMACDEILKLRNKLAKVDG